MARRFLPLVACLAFGVAHAQDEHTPQPEAIEQAPHAVPEGQVIPPEAGDPNAHLPGADHPVEGVQHAAGEHGEHGEGGHHGPHYTGDVDGDGVANWMDADADEALGTGTYVVPAIVWHAFNLVLVIGLLLWGLRPLVKDGLHKRAVALRTSIEDAANAKAEAERRHAEVADRLARLEGELTSMKDRARAEAVAEEARIAERADEAGRRIAETAQRQIADETARARNVIRAEAVELAVQLAEGILRKNVGAEDQQALARQFLASIDGEA